MKKWGITRRSIGIIVLCVVLVAGGVSAWVFRDAISSLFTHQQVEEPTGDTGGDDSPQGDTPDVKMDAVTIREVNKAIANGDSGAAVAIYDNEIAKADDSKVIAELYVLKAVSLTNLGKEQEAIQAAKQAEAIELTERVASLLAFIYERTGDNKEALRYYSSALELLDRDNDVRDKEGHYRQKISELGGV